MPTEPFQVWELYEFQLGSQIYRFTSSSIAITVSGNVYQPRVLERTSVAVTMEQARNALTIKAPSDFEVADLYYAVAPTETVLFRLKRYNEGGLGNTDLVWSGRLLNCEWNEEDQVEMQCEPITLSVGRNGLFRRFNRQCPYALYSPTTCKVDRTLYEHVTSVVGIYGGDLEVLDLGTTSSYVGGFVELATATHVERRFVEAQSGTTLTLMQPFNGIEVGDTVTVLPGCDRTTATCNGVYGNIENYGGFPYMQTTNVFATGLDINPEGALASFQTDTPVIPLLSITIDP